ncbi:cell division control protein 6 homolog [Cimex lectularius]|uniref:Cell division control protein n=1 Tax=Cimex lectularius TaxID=79782 RepID=A0A8I6RK14_CIMLE|nr:cell division control protein 6 homolog [Cimex lectularius]
MSSAQGQINFHKKKSLVKNMKGKENKYHSPVKDEQKRNSTGAKKRVTPTDSDNECSPPKQAKSPSALIERLNLENNKKKSDCNDESSPPKPPNGPVVLLERMNLENIEDSCKTNKSLSVAIRALHTAQPCGLPGREGKIKEISEILTKSLETKSSTSLYISGQPGTGKTACLNYIMAQPEIKSGYKNIYVNCTGMKSSKAVYKRIAEELNIKVKSTSETLSHNTILNYLKSPHKMILLVLDEMDQLESKHQSILYSIFEWPSVTNSRIVLIGIANALDLTDRVLPRLQARVELAPTLIHFTPYTKEEIVSIVTSRLTEAGVGNILAGGALQLLASKVASVSGDIRKALDIARQVIELAQMKDECGKTVALQDVLSVVHNVYNTASSLNKNEEDDAEAFPLQQKLFICTAVLIRQNSKSKELTITKLHDVYKKICEKRNISFLDLSEFLNLAQLIEARGCIKIQGKVKNRLSKVILQWDETEVSSALKDKQLLSTVVADTSCL